MQTTFGYPDDVQGQAARRRLLEANRAAVARTVIKELAYRLDVQSSLLAALAPGRNASCL